jgi:signal transduction histidine kinase
MQAAALPLDESERLLALRRLEVLDTAPEAEFDALVQAASLVCGSAISLISLVDTARQWFKANLGLDASETPREVAFCAHAILGDAVFEVPDATQDTRFHDNPLVTAAPDIRFYAGAPITLSDGARVGTLCVIDRVPRQLDDRQRAILVQLSRAAASALEGRRAALAEQRLQAERAAADAELRRLKDAFVAMAAHELRTPMTSILGFADLLLQRDMPPERQREYLQRIHRQCTALMALSQNMLDLASLDAQRGQDFQLQPMELLSWLREAGEDFAPPPGREAVRFAVAPELASVPVMADPMRLRQVLTNLLSNAYKYSPEGGEVVLSLGCVNGQAVFAVRDTGLGMRAEQLAHITERFYRADRSSGIAGTGLGMSVVSEIVGLLGGQLTLDSEPGLGTTARVSLPLTAR